MTKITNPKQYPASLVFLLGFLGALSVCYLLPRIIHGTVVAHVNISELAALNQGFSVKLSRLLELILMGPVFATIFYLLFKNFTTTIKSEQGGGRFRLLATEGATVFFLFTLVMGHMSHLAFNHANALYRDSFGAYATSELLLFIYFCDEWLGHHFIHWSYFALVCSALVLELTAEAQRVMNVDEICLTVVMGIGLGFVNGYATLEGQCAFSLFALSAALLAVELVVIFWKRIEVFRHPILFATIIGNIGVIATYVVWTAVFGSKLYYPFYFQPSELRSFG